ncbi:MAG: hypothetical protein RLZZ371_1735, partial [Pseudomonadota bacterium]
MVEEDAQRLVRARQLFERPWWQRWRGPALFWQLPAPLSQDLIWANMVLHTQILLVLAKQGSVHRKLVHEGSKVGFVYSVVVVVTDALLVIGEVLFNDHRTKQCGHFDSRYGAVVFRTNVVAV